MGIPQMLDLWAEAVNANDKEKFVSKWSKIPMWGDPVLLSEDAVVHIKDYLGQLWDAVHMSVREIYRKSGMKQYEIATSLGVPLRRIEDWCSGGHEPPRHVRYMMLRLLNLMPSFIDIIPYLTPTDKEHVMVSALEYKKQETRFSAMPNIKENKIWSITSSIPDMIAAGVELDMESIESELFEDIANLPPLEISAMVKEDGNGNTLIEFYYHFVSGGNLHFAIGVPLDPTKTPAQMLDMWFPTIVDEIDWEKLSEFYP